MYEKDSISFGSIQQSSVQHGQQRKSDETSLVHQLKNQNNDSLLTFKTLMLPSNSLSSGRTNAQQNRNPQPNNQQPTFLGSSKSDYNSIKDKIGTEAHRQSAYRSQSLFQFPKQSEPNLMSHNIAVVCLMQAAQIQRLTGSLIEYRLKLKEVTSGPLYRQSYETQIKELSEICQKLQEQNQQLQKYVNHMQSQQQQQELRKKQNLALQTAQKSQIKQAKEKLFQTASLQTKYQKCLQSLNKMYDDNEALTTEVIELKEYTQQLELRREAFERERIRQIQRMRESFEMLKRGEGNQVSLSNANEGSLFLSKDLVSHHSSSSFRQQFGSPSGQPSQEYQIFKQSLTQLTRQLSKTQQMYQKKSQQINNLQGRIQELTLQLFQQREANTRFNKSSQQQIMIFNNEVNSLSTKVQQLTRRQKQLLQKERESMERIERTEKENQRLSNKRVAQVERRLEQAELLCVQRTKQIKQALQKISQKDARINLLEESLIRLNSELSAEKQNYQQAVLNLKSHQKKYAKATQSLNQQTSQKCKQYYQQIQTLSSQLREQKRSFAILQQQKSSLSQHIESLISRHASTNSFQQNIIQEYQHKIRSYFEANQTLQEQLSTNIKETKLLRQQKLQIEKKIQIIQKQKNQISKAIQQQVLAFSQNNHKTRLLLQQRHHQLEIASFQQDCSENQISLLKEIKKIKNVISQNDKGRNQFETKELMKAIESMKADVQQINTNFNKCFDRLKSQQLHHQEQREILAFQQRLIDSKNQQTCQMLNEKILSQIKQIHNLKSKIATSHSQNESIRLQIESIKQQGFGNSQKIAYVVKSKELSSQEYQQLQQQLRAIKQQNECLQRQNVSILQQNQTFRKQNLSARQWNQQIQKQKDLLVQKTENLAKQITELQEKIQRQQSSLKSQSTHAQQRHAAQLEKVSFQLNNAHHQSLSQLHQIRQNLTEQNTLIKKRNYALVQENSQLSQQNKENMEKLSQVYRAYESLQRELKQCRILLQEYTEKSQRQNFERKEKQERQKFYRQEMSQKQKAWQSSVLDICRQSQEKIVKFTSDLQLHKKELVNREQLIAQYTEKIRILENQLQRYDQISQKLQSQNNNLKQLNYDFAIQLQKGKVTSKKIEVLNREITRLQRENIDLIEEVDICKFEICEDYSLEKRNIELMMLLVMHCAQIESLRSRVQEKDIQIDTIRKSSFLSKTSKREGHRS